MNLMALEGSANPRVAVKTAIITKQASEEY